MAGKVGEAGKGYIVYPEYIVKHLKLAGATVAHKSFKVAFIQVKQALVGL